MREVVVMGTGRSGTSIVAGMLHNVGIHMGDKFIPADKNNPVGTYEDVDFMQLNDSYVNQKDDFKQRAEALIVKKRSYGRDWGWKAPSTSNLLNIYMDLLPDAYYIICIRKKEEFVKSCQRAYGLGEKDATAMFNKRTENLRRFLNNYSKKLKLSFWGITNYPKASLKTIVKFLDLDITKDKIEEVSNMVLSKEEILKAKNKFK